MPKTLSSTCGTSGPAIPDSTRTYRLSEMTASRGHRFRSPRRLRLKAGNRRALRTTIGPQGPLHVGQTFYCTAFIISKIGRYIAITMPPTITPRITIIAGSMSESSALTATSTSSS